VNKTKREFSEQFCSSAMIWTSSIFCIYKNGRADVCLSVGMWRANGNPNPCTNLDYILHTHPHMPKEGFGAGLTPLPYEPGGPEILKADKHNFENVYKTKDVQQVAS